MIVLLSTIVAQGQIKIGGNVYGGGNKGNVEGNTRVTVKAGDIGATDKPESERPLDNPRGRVFGGARMADVGGNAFVNIDGEHATGYMVINQVYGGNDVAGNIGTKPDNKVMPTELTAIKANQDDTDPKKNAIDNTWSSYVRISNGTEKTYIGQLFAGGNGEFDYKDENGDDLRDGDDYVVKEGDIIVARKSTPFHKPEVDKAYLEVVGGSIVYAYGGGNNATVTEKTVIHVDNPSTVVNHILVDADGKEGDAATYTTLATNEANGSNELPQGYTDLLSTARFKEMGINTGFSFPSSGEFQIGRFFGGNNKAEMAIRPTWNLQSGKIRNLYSGGNRGTMTSPEGLLLEINPVAENANPLVIDNIYGGCRMADVRPTRIIEGVPTYAPCTNLQDKDKDGNLIYKFPDELAARVLVRGGDVNNVYGGNDVTGTVYGGNAIGIYTTIRGDVYGGGNGAYPYTDNEQGYKNDDVYGDFYYSTSGYTTSIDALNAFRPNAEQVSIRLKGTQEKPTVIKGSVFCGGNCASLATKKADPMVELKIGSYVLADKVFLGNNGEKMINETILQHYAGTYPGAEGFSSLNTMKTDPSTFASYMNGVVMDLQPSIVFDSKANGDPDDYENNTSQIGSFYCGGNVGSMAIAGKNTYRVDRGLVIFEKFVAGCNNADVEAGDYNAAYEGGILGAKNERGEMPGEFYTDDGTATGNIKDRIELNLDNLVVEPKRWNDTFTEITEADLTNGKLKAGEEYYTTNLRSSRFIANGTETASVGATNKYYKLTTKGDQLEWNTALWNENEDDFMKATTTDGDDKHRRLLNGNVYGGCYNSGHVNGNVIININQDVVKLSSVFAEADSNDPYKIKEGVDRGSGVLRKAQGDDTRSVAMSVFGAGYGKHTEIWGSTTINHNNGFAFQLFGGGEAGVVGKKDKNGVYTYNAAYSSTVNLKGPNAGYSEKVSGLPLAETEYIYGGGSEGDIIGDTYVYLGNGRTYEAFGGSTNADIYGSAEVYIGYNGGFPWIRNNIYGGNDFGGTIKGKKNHSEAISESKPAFDPQMMESSTYVKYIQGRVDSIFGGNYGYYDYADPEFKDYTYSKEEQSYPEGKEAGAPRDGFSFPNLANNSFVHFAPEENGNNKVGCILGCSKGYPGHQRLNNSMQTEAYVHVDDTKTRDVNRFANMDIYGGGAFAGTGTSSALGAGRTAIDLYSGSFHNVYGGCNQEGLVGYTRVNVPAASTVKVNAIFGGGKGYDISLFKTKPELAARYCDHYVTCVDYKSADAIVNDAIYGGNENCRIACDTYINIEAPVMKSDGYQATIYGAGYGRKTVCGRTNVFMNKGSNAYKVFGGGRDGNSFNFASLRQWLGKQFLAGGTPEAELENKVTAYGGILNDFGTYLTTNPINLPTNIGTYVNASGKYDGTYTNDILPTQQKPMPDYHQTNVHIMEGGNVSGYAYGGGYGKNAVISGSTYIELKGGNVDKDVYGGGQGGIVMDEFELKSFTAETNVNIEGGMCRNVYGAGYQGHMGKHCTVDDDQEIIEAPVYTSYAGDVPAVANVVIGKVNGTSFIDGIPAIQRNAYGGGEGGSVYGTTNLTINNGYIGYRCDNTGTESKPVYTYTEVLDDQKPNDIEKAGNAFGGGYVVNSYVDKANVIMYGGTIRGSLYGGGELGPVGAGTTNINFTNTGVASNNIRIFRPGKTQVKMYDGHVLRNVFGGGRGQDSWGGDGTKFMDEGVVADLRTNGMFCKGYVFGQTEVDIYGGEVGTDEGVSQGYGNVFGGGDIGCVYSAYEKENGDICFGKKSGTRYTTDDEGYYYKYENGNFVNVGNEKVLTEDCKVLVEPWCKALFPVQINSKNYAAGEYVPTSALNYLGNKTEDATTWGYLGKEDINKEGVIIHNAVFAGGNTSPGSTEVFANTPTVFGNATASIHDVFNRDLISIGRGRVGGLYGDGNLTLVDGYREVNVTNYGTDFYHINSEITLDDYNALPNREAAYYEIRYKCLTSCTDKNNKTYEEGATITADELQTVFEGVTVGEPAQPMIQADGKPLANYWLENGVCSRYAGRPLNTIQRADFCGVFGTRMVMQGAQDRVPETVDYTNYTINRVREVSLNKKETVRDADKTIESSNDNYYRRRVHGNYFGIYNSVNYLGALTSDVDFHDAVRTTENLNGTYREEVGGKAYGTATYYEWKAAFKDDRRRNNGSSHNKVALASGVFLELTNETGTGTGLYEKDWGLITGVVELDLINVQTGIGGGYVYAKNAHGIRSNTNKHQTILTTLNTDAVTNKQFQYDETENTKKEWETSGNFVHSTQTIIDDCYNIGGKYKSNYKAPDGVPAHYWFIKGAVYVYDQYISAYTGSPNAFSEAVSIPLTITSASHGKMTLLNVQPNLYAYYKSKNVPLGENDKIELHDVSYGLNDVINYWDWSQLTAAQKELFVPKTYVAITDCKLGNETYKAGTVLLPSEYETLKAAAPQKYLNQGDVEQTHYVHHISRDEDVDFDYVFRSSNNISHNTGYILTYNINNPNQWNTWYTPKVGTSPTDKKNSKEIESLSKNDYEDGPTYTPNTTGMYGQKDYKVGNVISKTDYDTYQSVVTYHSDVIPDGQATFYPAYIVTVDELETTKSSGVNQRLHKGATLAMQDYTETWNTMNGSVDEAYVVTSTVQLSKTEFIYRGTYMSQDERTTLMSTYPDLADKIASSVLPAYYCTAAGKYGGNYYQAGQNYRGLAAFTAMSETDREKFTYNYDALDLLIDPTYGQTEGEKYQYDGKNFTTADQAKTNKATYSLATSIDYNATYKGPESFTYTADDDTQKTATSGTELSRTEYERLTNEQYYYAPITVTVTNKTYYIVKETFVLGETPYAVGQEITSDTFTGLSDTDKAKVDQLTFTTDGTYYYCREDYTINKDIYTDADKGKVTDILSNTNNVHDTTVPAGIVITADNYNKLINQQTNFSIHGISPTETSSLYVAGHSDIFDLSKEKIITVIYQYDYVESDMTGTHITPVSERHILNIHLNFKSGVPTVEDIQAPDIILPGTSLSMPEPYVTPGAYEITGGGWKLFDTASDAESHTNGVDYTPSTTPLYLYQDMYYLAYYTKTYLGETFSNHVPVRVANYHDLKKVMDDKAHHYYIDHKDIFERLKVEPKIYINDYSSNSENGLDLFKNLYDLSLLTTNSAESTDPLYGHNTLNERIKGCDKLEFILRTDINHPNTWTSIASGENDPCFQGIFHGDGHTISGLNNSLFGKLCGSVYNLGVMGSFTSAGVADSGDGYVESCWINTTGTPASGVKAVFGGNPDVSHEQTVNCYYPESNTYTAGKAIQKPDRAFYNGEVAYNLNNFYLFKRYSDKQVNSGVEYKYWKSGEETPQTGHYAQNEALCSSGYNNIKYVEDRFEDGDFRFAAGVIPATEDERYWVETVEDEYHNTHEVDRWSPIWPDDYLFFGQKLTYGWAVEAHQDVPTAIVKNNGHLSNNIDANRVYRAPAYFGNKTMGAAHFNPQVYLAQKSKDGSTEAYPGMTAIDFAGHYDTHTPDVANKPYELGLNAEGKFYAPLLDDGGLTSIINCDETKNLLVYAPAETTNDNGYANKATYDVLTDYFLEPAFSDYYSNDKYRKVAETTSSIYGHLVMDKKIAKNDHLLVDKEDFNCPIAYDFDDNHRMWYQRKPEDQEYVDHTKGWQGISIPFTAELVTTNDKGEITHFYSGSTSSANSDSKIGHEYWLRELNGISIVEGSNPEVAKASFLYPTATSGVKNATNTFLWDYYYENTEVHNQKDKNSDDYQTYYNGSRTYTGYPLLTGGTPYIIGLPGQTYYEFDLSGNFEAKNTAAAIDKLGKQTITFASNTGATIQVSDDEATGVTKSVSGSKNYTLTFKPNYMNTSLDAGTYSYTLDADGDSYDKVTATTKVSAFRPYFTATVTTNSPKMAPQSILFGGDYNGLEGDLQSGLDGDLDIYVKDHKIVTTSHLKEATTICIINISGITMANYVLMPGETVETRIQNDGVYIVNKKKILVK